MKKQIYLMQDNMAELDDDCSFYLKTTCPQEELEEIVNASYYIHCGEDEEVAEEYQKYIEECGDWSYIEIIEHIVKDKGYTWEEVDFPVIEW